MHVSKIARAGTSDNLWIIETDVEHLPSYVHLKNNILSINYHFPATCYSGSSTSSAFDGITASKPELSWITQAKRKAYICMFIATSSI